MKLEFRGILFGKSGIRRMTPKEDDTQAPKHWTTMHQLYSLLGEYLITRDPESFDTVYVPDESSAGFEMKPPHYATRVLFHNMVNIKKSDYSSEEVHGWWNSSTLEGPVKYYKNTKNWWKDKYGDINKADFVQVLMADIDEKNSQVVMVFKPGQLLNDTRMFINFGELTRIKGYVPSNCSYVLGKKLTYLYRDTSGDIMLDYSDDIKDIKTDNLWLITSDQKV